MKGRAAKKEMIHDDSDTHIHIYSLVIIVGPAKV